MSAKVNASAPGAVPPGDEIPDLRQVIESEAAAEAAAKLLEDHSAGGESLHVGSLTDEELAVCTGSLGNAQPTGRWMADLGDYPRRVAMIAAFRSLTSREELIIADQDQGPEFSVSQRLMGLLRLRTNPARITALAMTPEGPTWYVLRRCEGAWLRELVSGQGFHTYDLVQLDETEEAFFRFMLQLQEGQFPSDVALTQPAGPPEGEAVAFLARQQHVTNVVLAHPDQDDPESLIVCHDSTGALTVGDVTEDGVTYAGADPSEVTARWRVWREQW